MRAEQIKKLAVQTMIGSLVGAATIAVVAVLVGEFNDILGKALFTLGIVTVHAFLCLGYLGNKDKVIDPNGLNIFSNTIFILIILSFFTAIFSTWEILQGSIIGQLYVTYFIAAFATLHGEMLHKTKGLNTKIDNLVIANYCLMAIVVVLILPLIWVTNREALPDFYYRLLSAAAIIDATLTILVVILHKLHLQKHPELKSQLFGQTVYSLGADGKPVPQAIQAHKKSMHPLLVILILFIVFQFVAPIFYLLFVSL